MNNGPLSDLFARLSQTLSRALLRHGQIPARAHHGAMTLWLLCIGALSLTLWIWPTQDHIHNLETTLRTRTIELRGLDERLREAEALNNTLQTVTTASPRLTQDPWQFLQGLAQAQSVHLLDYTPLPANPESDCQRLRLKMNGAPLAVQGLLQDLLHSPQSVERFTLSTGTTTDDRGLITLSLQVCIRNPTSYPSAHPGPSSAPSAALFQPRPKPIHTPRTVLEEHPLSAYRVIAIGRAAHDHYALVRTPAGKTHTVRPGMRLGDRGGKVHAILPNGIEIQQDTEHQSLLIGTPP